MTDYDRDTRLAYRSPERAVAYKKFNTTDWSWGRIATEREQRGLKQALARVAWRPQDLVLDIPCGTGILADVLHGLGCRIVASDISMAMMTAGRDEYRVDVLAGLVQADITRTPFPSGTFAGVFVLGFLHRVPREIKRAALREIARLSSRIVVVTCAMDTPAQRIKQRVLRLIRPGHVPAPCPVPLQELIADCEAAGLRLRESFAILPFLSAERVLVLEKLTPGEGTGATVRT